MFKLWLMLSFCLIFCQFQSDVADESVAYKERVYVSLRNVAAQNMKSSIKNFSSKCGQIRRKLRIWSYLLEKFLIENFIFCIVCNLFCYFVQVNFYELERKSMNP